MNHFNRFIYNVMMPCNAILSYINPLVKMCC